MNGIKIAIEPARRRRGKKGGKSSTKKEPNPLAALIPPGTTAPFKLQFCFDHTVAPYIRVCEACNLPPLPEKRLWTCKACESAFYCVSASFPFNDFLVADKALSELCMPTCGLEVP